MSNPLPVNPHIYKKGKVLNFKKLSEGTGKEQKNYVFSSHPGEKQSTCLIASTNNLNQITGRVLLGIYKLLSYFGLSKDPSEKLSRHTSNFGKYATHYFQRGGVSSKLEDTKNLLTEQNAKMVNLLVKQNEELKNLAEKIELSRNEALDFISKLIEIEEYLKKILG